MASQSKLSAYDWSLAPTFGRRQTILRALYQLSCLVPQAPCIVETGTSRDDSQRACLNDGWSTVAWGWYAGKADGQAFTVDLDEQALQVCRRLTGPYSSTLRYVCSDSIQFLQDWDRTENGPVHLLYLDSLDYEDKERSEAHQLAEAEAALVHLAHESLILVDDTWPDWNSNGAFRGNGARSIPYLLDHGFKLEWCSDGQVLVSRSGKGRTQLVPHSVCNSSRISAQSNSRRVDSFVSLPLVETFGQFQGALEDPAFQAYLGEVHRSAIASGAALELASGAGFGSIFLSKQGQSAEGIDTNGRVVERARLSNNILAGQASFRTGDPFILYKKGGPKYGVIHSFDFLHRFGVPWIEALVLQQVACAKSVVFCVPSAYSVENPLLGDERLLSLEEWRSILSDFDIADIRYVGDPATGANDHVLVVLDGKSVAHSDRSMMTVLPDPYPQGISAVVLTRNEARNIAECLDTLQG